MLPRLRYGCIGCHAHKYGERYEPDCCRKEAQDKLYAMVGGVKITHPYYLGQNHEACVGGRVCVYVVCLCVYQGRHVAVHMCTTRCTNLR